MGKKQHQTESPPPEKCDKFEKVFGFSLSDLSSPSSFVRLLNRPTDPASLGVFRFIFGVIMVLDVPQERGLAMADLRWGATDECYFPLFNFLQPLPLEWMYIVYLVMFLGAVGIMLGFMFRLSAVSFLVTYWYIFFLDKTSWNNHSYLYGIIGFLLLISDSNRYWSIDGFLNQKVRNAHVPLWNYTLLRFQIFVLYFIAGLKKLDQDWVTGYSMQFLSKHWVFDPFKFILTEDQIDMYIIHLGGLFIDLFLGFLLFFDKTRPLAFVMCSSFHLMNSQIFHIGMFSYTCLGTQFIFCYADWPRRLFGKIPSCLRLFTPDDEDMHTSSHCVYSKQDIKSEEIQVGPSKKQVAYFIPGHQAPTKPTTYHKIFTVFTVTFLALQLFLPYSHGLTKGYNNWTNGLYGYSWDMMVHSWKTQHVRITYVDKETGETGYLDPYALSGSKRWSSHADMLKQYAECFSNHLHTYNMSHVELYFDIWKSMNDRFQQRMFDPRVDILSASWSPFLKTSWVMPLLIDLSDWRGKLDEIEQNLYNTTNHTEVVFVADFPGLYLDNYVQEELGNTSITILKGEVVVELVEQTKNFTLSEGESMQVPAGEFHNVHTVSSSPSCYMYIYVNTTEVQFMKNFTEYEKAVQKLENETDSTANETLSEFANDPNLHEYKKVLAAKSASRSKKQESFWQKVKDFFTSKYSLLVRSIRFTKGALYSILTNSSFDDFLNATYRWENENMRVETQERIKADAKPGSL